MRCDNWSLMYSGSLSHDTIAAALFRDENTFRQNSPEAFLMHHHFEVTEMTLQEALWSKVKLSLISAPTNDLLTCKGEKGGGWGGGQGKAKGRRRIEQDERIPSTYSLHYQLGGGSQSFNYWLPSQANIPACQGPFGLSFGQSPSDGPHFPLNRTRRCCENGDTWSCVQEWEMIQKCLEPAKTPSTPTPSWILRGLNASKFVGHWLNHDRWGSTLMCMLCSRQSFSWGVQCDINV